MADPQTQTPERLPANFDFSKPITITAPDRLPADFDFEGASKKKETPTPPGFLDSYLDSIKGIFTGVAHDLRPKSRQEKVDAANHAVDVAAKYLHGNDTEKSAAKDEMISALPMGGTYLKVREGNYPGAAGDVAGLATVGLATHGIMNAPEIAGRVAESAPAAVLKAGVKAAAPDVAAGASKAAIGYGLSDVIPVGGPAGYALKAGTLYPGIRQMGKGVTKGVAAGRAALADRIAAGLEAAKAKAGPPPAVPGFDLFQGTTVEPPPGVPRPSPEPIPPSAGLLNRAPRTITPEAPPDTSYVRSVPAQYPEVQGPPQVPPKGLLGPGPERIITPPAPEDTSYVRSVPAEYPQGEGAPPAAPAAAAAAAPAAIDPGLLEGIAQANFKKPFAKLAAADQQAIRDTAAGFGRKIPEETRGPLPKFREGSESLGEPQPATQGKTIEQIVQEELAAGKQAEAPVTEQPAGRPDVESKPVETPPGSTEEPESAPQLESPRSEFLASGERKSSLLRAAEITAANTTAKAQRFAQAMHGYVSSNEVKLIPKSRWNAITNDLIIRGLLKPEEVPPNTSIPQIADFLRGIEASANKAKLTPAAPVKPGVSAPAPESTQPPAAPSSPLQTPSAGGAETTPVPSADRYDALLKQISDIQKNPLYKSDTYEGGQLRDHSIDLEREAVLHKPAAIDRATQEIAKEREAASARPTQTPKPFTETRPANAADLAARYKSQGIDRQRAWSQFVIDRQLKPEMDAKDFYEIYDAVSPSQSGRPAVESKPVQPSPGLTETSSNLVPGESGRAALQGALEKNKGTTAASKTKLTGTKPPAEMSGAEINKALDKIDQQSKALNDQFISEGRGNERPSETAKKTDPLSARYKDVETARGRLRNEVERRYGPGAPSRLPKGFGPIKKIQ